MKTISLFGLLLFLASLPVAALSFLIPGTVWTLFAPALAIGSVGLFFIALGILLKLGSILFRQ